MGLLDRMTTLVRANINDLLDRAEDPEVMLNQILRDMEEQIRQAREQVAAMIAQEKELESDLADAQQQAAAWNDRAELAVRHNQDALAREALARMNDATAHVTTYQQQLESQRAFVTRLRTQLDALKSKYDSAMNNRDALIARHRRAHAQQQVTTAMQSANLTDYTNDLTRMERRIRGEEAAASANADLADDGTAAYDALHNAELDDQLASLKRRLAGAASTGGPAEGAQSGSADPQTARETQRM
jgi:phage shock protein A